MPILPEIIVRGQRLIRPEPTFVRPGDTRRGGTSGAQERRELPPRLRDRLFPDTPDPTQPAFVPPVVPPQLLPEIVVTGTRVSAPAFGVGVAPAISVATLFGVVGGTLIAGILRDISQQRLDATMAELMVPERTRPDTPLETLPPEVIPEITVTASQFDVLRALQPQRLPLPPPLITPDFDPFVLVPIVPRVLPSPAALPDVLTPVPAIPLPIPAPTPAVVPLPLVSPSIAPAFRPIIQPAVSPSVRPDIRPGLLPGLLPAVQPAVQPGIATDPLTGTETRTVGSTATEFRLQAQPQLQAGQTQCPPPPQCKKDEKVEEERTQCWKKLVKEGLFPSLDRSFEWTEIDCLTGREL